MVRRGSLPDSSWSVSRSRGSHAILLPPSNAEPAWDGFESGVWATRRRERPVFALMRKQRKAQLAKLETNIHGGNVDSQSPKAWIIKSLHKFSFPRIPLMDSDTSVYSDDLPWSDDTKPSLTFAALWDPDEGMITFSGARLLETDATSLYTDTTSSFSDPPTEHVAPLSPLHGFRTFLYRVPSRSLRYREPRLTRTSSVVDAKDAPRRELRPSRSLHIPRQGFRADRTPQVERGVDEHSVTPKRGYLVRLSPSSKHAT